MGARGVPGWAALGRQEAPGMALRLREEWDAPEELGAVAGPRRAAPGRLAAPAVGPVAHPADWRSGPLAA